MFLSRVGGGGPYADAQPAASERAAEKEASVAWRQSRRACEGEEMDAREHGGAQVGCTVENVQGA